MSRKWLRYIPVLAGILATLALSPVVRADSGLVAPLEELPLTNPLATGARAAGMGFVSMAIADDGTAITSNPAALTRLNRVELSGGFRRSALAIDGEMAGSSFSTDLSGTDFSSLRFAYPFPTFRGSLVFGVSAERIYDFAGDRLAAYEDEIEWDEHPHDGLDEPDTSGVWWSEEDYVSDGGVTALSVACAVDISPSISLGATFSYLTGDYSRSWGYDLYDDYDVSDRYIDVHKMEQYDADISGMRVTLGGLFYVAEGLSVGVAIDTPATLTFDGTEWGYIKKVATVPESTEIYDGSVLFSESVTLPFAFRGGVAYAPLDFIMVGVDLSYSDWSEIDYEGRITEIDQGTRRALNDEKLGYGVGLEVTVPSWPLRLRGGYASRPISYNGLEVTSDRCYYTLGAGILIDTVLAVDVAWMKGSYERADDEYAYLESVDDSGFIVEATYRF